jgi:hypothetical protein
LISGLITNPCDVFNSKKKKKLKKKKKGRRRKLCRGKLKNKILVLSESFIISEEMDEHRALFKEVFGESSDSEDYEQQQHQPQLEDRSQRTTSGQNPYWEQIKEINGLWVCRDFLSAQEQSSLLSAIENGVFHAHPLFLFFFG